MMAGRKRNQRKLYILLVPAIMAAAVAVVVAANIDPVVELGQPNFTTSGFLASATQTGFALPYGVAIDRTAGHLYVADTANNRVLGWSSISALTNGAPADLVIGQSSFTSNSISVSQSGLNQPWSVAVDSEGNLYVSDNGNNRVLEYNSPYNAFTHTCNVATPCGGGLAASLVFGQGTGGNSFTTNSSNCTTKNDTSCFDEPSGIAIDSNDNLFVTDTVNDRLLVFLNPLATSSGCNSSGCAGDVIADFSLGECAGNSGFLDGEGNCARPAVTMLGPNAVAVDSSGNVFVTDAQNNRVLEFDNPAGTGNLTADRVYGAGSSGSNFIPAVCANGRGVDPKPSATDMCNPTGLTLDSANNLYVSDYGNSRVLEFPDPLTNFTATLVIGQDSLGTNFTSGICYGGQTGSGSANSASATGLCNPAGLGTDAGNNLYVADANNSRMIEFSDPAASPSITATPGATDSATASASPTATISPTPAVSVTPTASAAATVSATATAINTATVTPTAIATAMTALTPTTTPTATATPTPIATSTPTATPTPIAEKLTVSAKTLNFGKVFLNESKTLNLTIKNAETAKKGHTVQVGPESSSNPEFSITQQCNTTLPPGKNCVVKITFAPGSNTASQRGDLTVDANVVALPLPVKLEGSGKVRKK
jgi:hypothetical protein